MNTVVFTNHPPIRYSGEPVAHFIKPAHYGIGGDTLLALRNAAGEYLIWLESVSAWDVPTRRRFVGKFRPGQQDAMESPGFQALFSNETEYGPVPGWAPYSVAEQGEIRLFLDSLGLSRVEEFE